MASKKHVTTEFVLALMLVAVHGRAVDEGNLENGDTNLRPPRALLQLIDEMDGRVWLERGQVALKHQLSKKPNTNKAKNVIMFLGDGMSVATVTAARILRAQRLGYSGEESKLFFEEFPFTGLSKTYCVDKQVADSACSATAYLGGVKTNFATIGVTAAVQHGDCRASTNPANHVESISEWAQREGKSTGFVTTTRVTHASPAGTYAHIANRDWEADSNITSSGNDPKICPDIAYQLVNHLPGKNHRVIMGGGRKNFLPKTERDEDNLPGVRDDGVNLIKLWLDNKESAGASAAYVSDREALLNVQKVDYLLGLFDNDHMQYHMDADPNTEPTLAEMTQVAIKQLSSNHDGYFLFVEGGRIDQGHHANTVQKALDETIEFAEAVRVAASMVGDDTLMVVTADHSHTMSIAGYPKRGNDILGFAGNGTDGLVYSTLSYANGVSYKPEKGGRLDLSKDDRHNANYTFPAAAPLVEETHGGDDVQVFAKGPWAHLFVGAYEQNVIPHIMAYASCIGRGLTACS